MDTPYKTERANPGRGNPERLETERLDPERLETEQLQTEQLEATHPRDLARAAAILRSGGTVAFPTETVYGLGANALSAAAVERIFQAKQRPHWDPLIVHIAHPSQLGDITLNPPPSTPNPVLSAASLPPALLSLWPGPLTLLLPRNSAIPESVTAGRPLVGVRIPAHPVALQLLRLTGLPIAAPSANTFGHTSPTTAAHVLADLNGRIDAVLDGGPTSIGLESTVAQPILDPDGTLGLILYRPGAITLAQLAALPGIGHVRHFAPAAASTTPASLPSPGVGIRHYAPRARLLLVPPDLARLTHTLLPAMSLAQSRGHSLGALLPDSWASLPGVHLFAWGPWESPATLAAGLYSGLRALDDAGVHTILCPLPPGEGLPAAIRDRLEKAARTI